MTRAGRRAAPGPPPPGPGETPCTPLSWIFGSESGGHGASEASRPAGEHGSRVREIQGFRRRHVSDNIPVVHGSDGAEVVQYTAGTGAHQQWQLVPA
jgi:hypothetical protein